MFCKTDQNRFSITVEDTLELLFVRLGKEGMNDETRILFGYYFEIAGMLICYEN